MTDYMYGLMRTGGGKADVWVDCGSLRDTAEAWENDQHRLKRHHPQFTYMIHEVIPDPNFVGDLGNGKYGSNSRDVQPLHQITTKRTKYAVMRTGNGQESVWCNGAVTYDTFSEAEIERNIFQADFPDFRYVVHSVVGHGDDLVIVDDEKPTAVVKDGDRRFVIKFKLKNGTGETEIYSGVSAKSPIELLDRHDKLVRQHRQHDFWVEQI